jgi:hypothetical protein
MAFSFGLKGERGLGLTGSKGAAGSKEDRRLTLGSGSGALHGR